MPRFCTASSLARFTIGKMLLRSLRRYSHLIIFAIFLRRACGYDSVSEAHPAVRQSHPRLSDNPEQAASSSRSDNEEEEKEEISVAGPVARILDILNEEETASPAPRFLEDYDKFPNFRTLPVETDDERSDDTATPRLFDPPESDEQADPRFTSNVGLRDVKRTRVDAEISTGKKKEKKTVPGPNERSSNSSAKLIDDIFDSLRGGREGPRSKLASKDDPEEPQDVRREKFAESGEKLDELEKPKFRALDDDDELKGIPALQKKSDGDEETSEKDNGSGHVGYRFAYDFFDQEENPDNGTIVDQSEKISTRSPSFKDFEETTERSTKPTKSKQKRRRNRRKHTKKRKIPYSRNNTFPLQSRKALPGHPVIFSEQEGSGTTQKKLRKYEGIDRIPSIKFQLTKIKRKPEMKSLHYDTTVRSRYARTTIAGLVKNHGETRDINVNVILPHNALITKFETDVDGETTSAVLKGRNSTTGLPKASVNGENVGTMLVETRDCDAVVVSVLVPGDATLNYTVTYEYLLERNLGVYTVPITVHNNMWIKDLSVRWRIQEERNLTTLKTPMIHKTTSLASDNTDDPMVCIIKEKPGMAEVVWNPTIAEQKNISGDLGKLSKHGIVGILELIYDVIHDQDPCGQVVRQNEYFAQFFAAPNQPPLAKHVVFILDASDSMQGDPIKQLKTAMYYILDTLQPLDNFTLINFSDEVNIMNIYDRSRDTIYRGVGVGPDGRGAKSGKTAWPGILETYQATPSNVKLAKESVKMMELRAFTNMYDALIMGFKSVKDISALPSASTGQPHPEPFIIFLTDGHASDGPSYDHDVILKMVEDQNHNTKATMFALGFGGEADMGLLRRFALATNGIEKHIYKDIDAADQLVTFFQSIKAPILKDLYFKYSSKQVITSTLTAQSFPMIHRGKEAIIAGMLDPTYPEQSSLYVDVTALGRYSVIRCERTAEKTRKFAGDSVMIKYSNATSTSHMVGTKANRALSAGTVERIWGFLTLSQLRDEIEHDHFETHQDTRCDDSLKPMDRMLEICLRLNYAMPMVTNLVYNDTVVERISISPESGEQPEETKQFDPLAEFPWIVKIRDKHGYAKLPITNNKKGRMYTYLSLGVSENPPPPRSCADAVDGAPGECRYLPECPDPRLLGSPQKFRSHFCKLGSYAGVCCSESVQAIFKSNGYV